MVEGSILSQAKGFLFSISTRTFLQIWRFEYSNIFKFFLSKTNFINWQVIFCLKMLKSIYQNLSIYLSIFRIFFCALLDRLNSELSFKTLFLKEKLWIEYFNNFHEQWKVDSPGAVCKTKTKPKEIIIWKNSVYFSEKRSFLYF